MLDGVPAPNPSFPQQIHVVTGNNTIEVTGKNLMNYTNANFIASSTTWFFLDGTPGAYGSNLGDKTNIKTPVTKGTEYTISFNLKTDVLGASLVYENEATVATIPNSTTIGQKSRTFTSSRDGYIILRVRQTSGEKVEIENIQIEKSSIATTYEPYYHQDYAVNLGSLELCKIGDAQDFIFKNTPDSEYYDSSLVENSWYKYEAVKKIIFNGTENWRLNGSGTPNWNYRLAVDLRINAISANANSLGYINKFTRNSLTTSNTEKGFFYSSSNSWILIRTEQEDTLENFKSSLSQDNLIVYGILQTPTTTQITDTTLIAQLDAIYEHLQLTKGINYITVTASDLAPYMELSYMQDLPTKLNNLASRIELLEE